MAEVWRDVAGFKGVYSVSNLGRVRRNVGFGCHTTRLLSLNTNTNGYYHVSLHNRGTRVVFMVHKLVALAFLGPCPTRLEVNHKSGVKTNNRLGNLEYVTHAENMKHASRLFRSKQAKIIVRNMDWVAGGTFRDLMRTIGLSDVELARRLMVGRATAYRWNKGKKVPSSRVMRKAVAKLGGVKMEDVTWTRTT